MKQKIIILFALFIIKASLGFGQIQQLINFNFSAYVGKPVDSLIQHLPSGITSMKVVGGHRGAGDRLEISYPNNVTLYVKVKKFQFMDPSPHKRDGTINVWDVNLFIKEAMAYAIVYDANGCEIGCENQCQGCPSAQ